MHRLARVVPILPVTSVPCAVEFYRRLGFSARLYAGADSYAFLIRDELEVHLRQAPDLIAGHNPAGAYFVLQPDGAAQLEAEFRAAGVAVLSALAPRPWGMVEFMLSDPDGNLLRFGEAL